MSKANRKESVNKTIHIEEQTARRAVLAAAAGFPSGYTQDRAGAITFIRAVGYIQIDTISVVARSHEHVLWNRVGSFSTAPFASLEAFEAVSPDKAKVSRNIQVGANAAKKSAGSYNSDRQIFEYWAHAAAYLPIEDYRFCLPRMERVRRDGHDWFHVDRKEAVEVLERVRSEGPLSAKAFVNPKGKAGTWWDWKPAKRALEYLFQSGQILVAGRRGFVKFFDLPERVLPASINTSRPTERACAEWLLNRAVNSYGLFTAQDLIYGRRDGIESVGEEIAERVADGRLIAVQITGTKSETHYISPKALEAACSGTSAANKPFRYHILSPFDPLLINRKRLKRIFNFNYALECYVPEAKRRFGYFALPILQLEGLSNDFEDKRGPILDGRFVGLLDAKADRGAGLFRVKKLELAPEADRELFSETLRSFTIFNACDKIQF